MSSLDKANAAESNGASIGMSGTSVEHSKIVGIYHAVCRGYKAVHEAEYLRLWPALVELRKSAGAAFSKNLSDMEFYMESLTEVKWDQHAPNVVATVGANAMLDAALSGSSYSVVGPFMGLIGAVGFTAAPVIADTMASHAGWTEAGVTNAPTYTGPRKTIAWAAASGRSKSPSSAPVFSMTGSGTIKGVFIVYGAGAVSTIDSTAGVLFSAGLFTGGDQLVANTNTCSISYSTSI